MQKWSCDHFNWSPHESGLRRSEQIVRYEMTLFLYDSGILDSSIPFLGLIHCECLLVKDYFLIVVLDGIRYRYWVINDDRYKVTDDYKSTALEHRSSISLTAHFDPSANLSNRYDLAIFKFLVNRNSLKETK